jgi:fructosamine-3-kinase
VLRRTTIDDVRCLVKTTSYDAQTEAAGLDALRDAGAHVPRVVTVDEHELVIEEVAGDGDWAACAERLALVHRATGPAFGWERDGWIGPLPMANPWSEDWPSFYAEHRLEPWVDDLDTVPARRLRGAIEDARLARLLDHDVSPSLVHGDLWSGNVVGGQWLIDPAIHRGDRELDLAMARLFGGFPAAFFATYAAAWPLDDGWEDRLPALQLFHLLVHVRLFGGGYQRQVVERLDALGW